MLGKPVHTSEGMFLNCPCCSATHLTIPPYSAPPSLSVALQTLAALVCGDRLCCQPKEEGPISMKSIITPSPAATPAQLSGEESEPSVPRGSEWKPYAGWKMPCGWALSPGDQDSLWEDICPSPGSAPEGHLLLRDQANT